MTGRDEKEDAPMTIEKPVEKPGGVSWYGLPLGLIGVVIGFALGIWIGHRADDKFTWFADTGQNDFGVLLAYVFSTIGLMAGLGFLDHPVRRMAGRRPALSVKSEGGLGRYFKMSVDHKVIGLQYLFGIAVFFFIGGLNAMLIRTELLRPSPPVFSPGQYLTIVGMHSTMMVMMTSSIILGPFGHYFVPLMIGARRMAFPRLESLSFWLLMYGAIVLLTAMSYGGFPTGWTGYPPLATQANAGMDAYIFAFFLTAVAMILNAINMMATIIGMRAPGLSWGRLPIFVWGMLTTSVLMLLGPPMLIAALFMEVLDRLGSTSFYTAPAGGSPFLYENLFWFFGHPEVYILALPGFALVLEVLPVFCRKPLWGYRVAVAGLVGVTLLSFMVWQHHLFMSGINSSLRPFYMFSTELISVPTGFVFLAAMGTIWRAKIRFTVPMLFALAFFFNFLLGGLSGVFLSDVPSDVTLHGSYFVMAHFHYTIMGGLIFAFFAGFYYWHPKMTGVELNETLGKVHFWLMFIAFNSTFMPLFALGLMGMPRRVSTYAPHLQFLNEWASVSAYVLGFSLLIFLANWMWSVVVVRNRADANPWDARGLEWQLPTPVPAENFSRIPTFLSGPYEYGSPTPTPLVQYGPLEPGPAAAGD
jgi:cytochrome c oxidase subunit I